MRASRRWHPGPTSRPVPARTRARPLGLALRGKTRRCVSAGGDTARVIGKRRGPGGAAEPGGGLPRGLALLVAGAFFMEILDGTVIAPAAPLIAADLGIRAVDVNVAISGYLVTVAVLIPISGWAADRFGARRVFATAIALFTLASAGCAARPGPDDAHRDPGVAGRRRAR